MAQVIWTNRAIRELNEVVEHIEKEDMKIAREIAAEAFQPRIDTNEHESFNFIRVHSCPFAVLLRASVSMCFVEVFASLLFQDHH